MLGLPLISTHPDRYHGKYVASMFASGEQGVWYDPSDLSTMFQDAAGTIPVTAVGQPVGLMLDKSKNGVEINGTKRVNLLSYTEQFDNSAWVKYSSTISGNAAVDPLGRSAADKLIESNTNNAHYIWRGSFSVSIGQTYIFSCSAKAAERNKIFLGSHDGLVGWGVSFNLANGTISGNRIGSGLSLVSSSSIDSLGNGWYRCMIVPAEHVDLARVLCETLAGAGGDGMFTTPLSADGSYPASHYISSGLIEDGFANLLPLLIQTETGMEKINQGQPEIIHAAAQQAGLTLDQPEIERLLAAVDVSDQSPFEAMDRLGVRMVQGEGDGL